MTPRTFLDLLLQTISPVPLLPSPSASLHLVLTLRADFLGQALSYRPFADALDQTQRLLLGPMTREELEAVIARPAEQQGVTFEDGLVARILDDVGDEPGNLPLLEFALAQLWERQEGNRLTHATYEAVGKVEGALTLHADQVYEGLSEAEREHARRIFVQLVHPGEGTEDTRRRATQTEIGQENWVLVPRLAGARLVVTDRDPTQEDVVEVAHEALIQGWRRLQAWMNEDHSFRVWQERLRAALRQWETSGRDKGALLRGVPLAEAENWLAERESHLSQPEKVFIQASVTLRAWLQRRVMMIGFLPYLILTLIVSLGGIYVMTRLVVSSIDERLTNQLLEAGRVVSDSIAIRETEHLEAARGIAFTTGLNDALEDDDRGTVVAMAHPLVVLHNLEYVIVTDASGQAVLHTVQQDDGTPGPVEGQFDTSGLQMVRMLLDANDPDAPPKRGLVEYTVNGQYYYFTALPIGLGDQVVGVVIVGTSLDTLLTRFKNTSLADVIIYLDGGRAVATTFALTEQPDAVEALLNELSTTPAEYERVLYSEGSTIDEQDIRGRSYRFAYVPLRVGDDTLGAFSIALPLQFVIENYLTSRNTYAFVFSIAALLQGIVGYIVARSLVRTVLQPVRVSAPSPKEKD